MEEKNMIYRAYLFEKQLAARLKGADSKERRSLYNSVYNEYYQKFPKHPFIVQNENVIKKSTSRQIKYLRKYCNPNITFLEIGSGTGDLSFEVAKYVKKVIMVDVSHEPTQTLDFPPNTELLISNGVSIPLPKNCVDIAYSNQLMEHLHPEDALEQLQSIYDVLVKNGTYICVTPHCFSGPHDISKGFDKIAHCFHLKEYTVKELTNYFKAVGFKNVTYLVTFKGIQTNFPIFIIIIIEKILSKLPYSLRNKLASNLPLRLIFSIRLLGKK